MKKKTYIPFVFLSLCMFIIVSNQDYCNRIHALFDVNIVSDSKPGEKYLYHLDVISKMMKMKVFTEKQLREIEQNNTKTFLEIPKLNGKGPTEMEINECYLDTTKAEEERCKYTRIYQISKFFYHDVVNLYRYYELGHQIENAFDMYAHWVELADFYLLHPDVISACPQPNTTNCGPARYEPEEKKNYRLVFRPICYNRINMRNETIALKMDPTNIYNELFRDESHDQPVQDRWYRLTVTYNATNGLKEEVRRLCLLTEGSDFCFIGSMVNIYRRYLKYKKKKEKSEVCRKLLMFNFEDFVMAKTRPKLIDFWVNEWKSGGSTNSSEFEFVNDNFPRLFQFIRTNNREKLGKAMNCLVYPLRFMNSCMNFDNSDDNKCMLGQVINKIHHYVASNQTNMNIIDTSIDLKEYISYFRLDTLLNNIETKTQKLIEAPYLQKIYIQRDLHEYFKGMKKYLKKIGDYNQDIITSDIKSIEDRMDEYIVSSEKDSKTVARVLDILIHAVVVLKTFDPEKKKMKWGITLVEALNPLAKISRNTIPSDIFDSIQDIIKRNPDLEVNNELRKQILKLANIAYSTKIGFFKNIDLTTFARRTFHHLNNTIVDVDFARNKALFLKNYDDYSPWITKEQLTKAASFLQGIRETSCGLINETRHLGITENAFFVFEVLEKGSETCKTAEADIGKMIETFKETYDFQFELLQTFSSYIQSKETYFAMSSLTKQIDKPISTDWFETYFLSLYSRLMIYFEQLILIDRFCDLREYKEFGVRPVECNQYPSSIEVNKLIHTDKSYCEGKTAHVRIPITPGPKKENRHGFIKLEQLFDGSEIMFQIPNVIWLLRNKWISENNGYPLYIRKFQIFLPTISEKKRHIIIHARLAGNNVLTPNQSKQFVIRPTPQLNSEYLEGKNAFLNCTELLENPYGTCPKPGWDLPKICSTSPINEDPTKAYGSIYAIWKFTVSGYEGRPIPIPAFKNDTFIQAAVQICKKDSKTEYRNKDNNDKNKKREKRIKIHGVKVKNEKRSLGQFTSCCFDGHYFSQSEEKCLLCPNGFKRALKGYYCKKDSF